MEFVSQEGSEGSKRMNESEQNLQWLRERGVQVQIPSSREKPSSVPVDHTLDRSISLVKIPCDVKQPYEEISVMINDGIAGDQLLDILKPRFVGTGKEAISSAALEKASEGLLKSANLSSATSGSSILDQSPEVQKSTLLNMFENQGHVEAFSLTHASDINKWKSVAFYLDEGGQLKGLPPNPRAMSIAETCGFQGVSLAGDIYVARRFQEGVIRHVSFPLADIDSSAAWMKRAEQDNYAHGSATGQVSMDQSLLEGIDKGIHISSDPCKSYEWNQDEDTVDISFKIPEEHKVTSSKQLDISISSQRIAIKKRVDGSEDVLLLELNLFSDIKISDSTWSKSGNIVEFALEKKEESDWKQLESI